MFQDHTDPFARTKGPRRKGTLPSNISTWQRKITESEGKDGNDPLKNWHDSASEAAISAAVVSSSSEGGYDLWLGVLASSVETSCRAGAGIATLRDRTICFAGIFRP